MKTNIRMCLWTLISKVKSFLLFALVLGCQRHPMDFHPAKKLTYSTVYKLCCGTWQIDDESLAYYRDTLGYRTALSVTDHYLILYPNGEADIRCDGTYSLRERADDVKTALRIFLDQRPPSVFHGVRGRWTVRKLSDIPKEFAAWEFEDSRPLGWEWQVAITKTDTIIGKDGREHSDWCAEHGVYQFFLGEDERGLYLAPPTYSSNVPKHMERVLRFREINGPQMIKRKHGD